MFSPLAREQFAGQKADKVRRRLYMCCSVVLQTLELDSDDLRCILNWSRWRWDRRSTRLLVALLFRIFYLRVHNRAQHVSSQWRLCFFPVYTPLRCKEAQAIPPGVFQRILTQPKVDECSLRNEGMKVSPRFVASKGVVPGHRRVEYFYVL